LLQFRFFFYGLCLVGLLAGCGFRPLYKQGDKETLGQLSKIKIAIIPDRHGQLLRNDLLTRLTPYGAPDVPLYELKVHMNYEKRELSLLKDSSTSRSQIILKVNFDLNHLRTGKTLYQGFETLTADFNTLMFSPYSNLVSEENAKNRLIDEVAQSIKIQLATFFTYNEEVTVR
jgi:LPS-assembly lipoprotein